MTALCVSIACVVLGVLLWDFGRRTLQRKSEDFAALNAIAHGQSQAVAQLQAEIRERDGHWATAFEGHVDHVDKRLERVEGAMRTVDPGFSPLGKRYDTRQRS